MPSVPSADTGPPGVVLTAYDKSGSIDTFHTLHFFRNHLHQVNSILSGQLAVQTYDAVFGLDADLDR